MLLDVVDQKSKKVGQVDLGKTADEKINKAVLYYALKALRNNLRHGTVKTKTRSEVNRTNKKVYRQKGTGNARHGARSVNIYVGGGNVFGPTPRSYFEHLNKKTKQLGYREVLKHLAQADALKVVDKFAFDNPSTKAAAKFLADAGFKKALIVLPLGNDNASRSFRNLKDVQVVSENNLNLFDMLRYENVVLTSDFLNQLKGRYGL